MMMKYLFCACLLPLGPLSAAAQSPDERLLTVVSEAQLAAVSDSPRKKRDHYVTAAYEARRIVEDAPESASAAALLGDGLVLFGSAPITYNSLVDEMASACAIEPSRICIVDTAYSLQERLMAPHLEDAMATKIRLGLTDRNFGPGFATHRADAVVGYAELGLADRVLETYAFHLKEDGKITVSERAVWAGRFAYALARIGEVETAMSVAPGVLEDTDNEDGALLATVENFLAPAEAMLAVALITNGDAEAVNSRVPDLKLTSLFKEARRLHEMSGSAKLREYLSGKLDDCVGLPGFAGRTCIQEMIGMHAFAGDLEGVEETAAKARNPESALASTLYEFLRANHVDEAVRIFNSAKMKDVWAGTVADLAITSGNEALLSDTIAKARALEDQVSRDRTLGSIAASLVARGREAEGVALIETVSDADQRNEFHDRIEILRTYREIEARRYGDAIAKVRLLEHPAAQGAWSELIITAMSDPNLQ